jgi:hypothetical protein
MRSLQVNDMVRSLVAPDERVVGVHVELLEPRPQTLSPMGRVRFAIGGKVWLGPDHPLKLLIIRVEVLQVKQPVVSTTVEMVGCDPAVHRTPSPLCRPKVVHPTRTSFREYASSIGPVAYYWIKICRFRG